MLLLLFLSSFGLCADVFKNFYEDVAGNISNELLILGRTAVDAFEQENLDKCNEEAKKILHHFYGSQFESLLYFPFRLPDVRAKIMQTFAVPCAAKTQFDARLTTISTSPVSNVAKLNAAISLWAARWRNQIEPSTMQLFLEPAGVSPHKASDSEQGSQKSEEQKEASLLSMHLMPKKKAQLPAIQHAISRSSSTSVEIVNEPVFTKGYLLIFFFCLLAVGICIVVYFCAFEIVSRNQQRLLEA